MRRVGAAVTVAAALVACLSPAAAGAANDAYVAMGDSYSSGTGTRDYYESDCQRSNAAYSKLIDPSLPGNLNMVACSGAKTTNIDGSGQNGHPAQGNDPALGPATKYVTISIGGNDAGFSDVLLTCGEPSWLGDCDAAVDEAQRKIRDVLPSRLDAVYNLIRSRSPHAAVTVVGYPRIFNGEDCNAATFFSGDEMTRLNQTADQLADTTRVRAQAHGFGFSDPRGAFISHAVCDEQEWLNGLSNPTGESFHPNATGHSKGYSGIVGAALLAQPSPDDVRGPNGRIAFTRGAAGSEDVFAINGNGQFPKNLTAGMAGAAVDPAFSPGGTKIAFASTVDGNFEIYVADSDGTNPVRLTNNAAVDREPAWSPNGAYIAFRSDRTTGGDIYKVPVGGGTTSQLTENAPAETAPAWSPDGAEIAYQRAGDVWKMNADGQGQTQLTNATGTDGAPDWSPNGSQIAFQSSRDGDDEIFTMSATGGSQTQRTSNTASDAQPAWAPSGASIAFTSNRDAGDPEIYTMTSTGGSQVRRTTSAGTDTAGSWQADSTAPETSIAPTPERINTASPSFDLGSSEDGSTFECQVDSGAMGPCSDPATVGPLSEGPHTFAAVATDPSGNRDASAATRSFTIDTTPALTAITAGPSGPTNQAAATFEFGAADPETTFTCSVDGTSVADPCASPFTTAALPDGSHTFTVAGSDGVNVDTDTSEFVVDTVQPDTSLTSGPGPDTNQIRPSFELAAEAGSTFECRIDAAAFEACPAQFVPGADLADGPHVFEARATDAAGNHEAEPLAVAFTVDTVLPEAAIDSGPPAATEPPAPPAATSDPSHPFTFSSADPTASFECRLDSLDDADWAPCSSAFTPAELADGSHVFEVRALDPAGNVGPGASRNYVVDATDPTTTILAGPADGEPTNRAVFSFESDDQSATFECRLDSASADAWQHCEPGEALTGLTESPHQFEVRAVDQVGNRDESPAVATFTYDETEPDTTISGPSGPTNDPMPTFDLQALTPGPGTPSFECSLDGADFGPCSSSHTTATLADGAHELRARAIDAAGNADSSPAVASFRVDTEKPTVGIDGPLLTNDPTPTYVLTLSEDLGSEGFSCTVDSAESPCVTPFTVSPPLQFDGEHTLEVTASDEAGNSDTEQVTIVLDRVAPSGPAITAGPSGLIADRTPTYEFSSASAAGFQCRLDTGGFAPCASPFTPSALADGPHSFQVRAMDGAGNGSTPASRSIVVDATAPTTSIEAGPRETVRDRAPVFTFRSADPTARFECRLDTGAFAACASPYAAAVLAFGPHAFTVRAIDAAGNVEPSPQVRRFTIAPPENEFVLGKPKLNARRGTAKLPVGVPGPGVVELTGKGIAPVKATIPAAGGKTLRVATTGSVRRRLLANGSTKVKASVRFTPDGGEPRTLTKRLKLIAD